MWQPCFPSSCIILFCLQSCVSLGNLIFSYFLSSFSVTSHSISIIFLTEGCKEVAEALNRNPAKLICFLDTKPVIFGVTTFDFKKNCRLLFPNSFPSGFHEMSHLQTYILTNMYVSTAIDIKITENKIKNWSLRDSFKQDLSWITGCYRCLHTAVLCSVLQQKKRPIDNQIPDEKLFQRHLNKIS